MDGALNAVIVYDFSADVTRSALLAAMFAIEQESATGLHRGLGAVFYHSGYVATGVPGPNWLWVKPGLPERTDIVRVFRSIVEEPLLDARGAAWS